jgi:hypothetical protein
MTVATVVNAAIIRPIVLLVVAGAIWHPAYGDGQLSPGV